MQWIESLQFILPEIDCTFEDFPNFFKGTLINGVKTIVPVLKNTTELNNFLKTYASMIESYNVGSRESTHSREKHNESEL